jgi:hypothetical protein
MKVPYRYFKTFNGFIKFKDNLVRQETKFFVRNETINANCDLSKFKTFALEKKSLRKVTFGRFPVYAIKARDFLNISVDLLKSDIYSLIKEGNL